MSRIFSQDVKPVDLLSGIVFHHLGGGLAGKGRQESPPGLLKLKLNSWIVDRLVADVDIGKGAHIAGPLDVVLTAQGHYPS